MTYTHLTQDERYQIAILAKAGHDQSEIARLMKRHKSTIGRETPPQSRAARLSAQAGA
jgi:IS30 family transposase